MTWSSMLSTTKNSINNSIWNNQGWALKKRSTKTPLSAQQVKFLDQLYARGDKPKKQNLSSQTSRLNANGS